MTTDEIELIKLESYYNSLIHVKEMINDQMRAAITHYNKMIFNLEQKIKESENENSTI